MEGGAVFDSERRAQTLSTFEVSEYNKLLTKRLHLKGLLPCLRRVHPSIELISEADYSDGRDESNL